jgi:hypothetical protein
MGARALWARCAPPYAALPILTSGRAAGGQETSDKIMALSTVVLRIIACSPFLLRGRDLGRLSMTFQYGLVEHGENTLAPDEDSPDPFRLADSQVARVDQFFQGAEADPKRFGSLLATIHGQRIDTQALPITAIRHLPHSGIAHYSIERKSLSSTEIRQFSVPCDLKA